MKKIGYLLVFVGFIAASLVTVTDVLQVNWVHFGIFLVICILGIFLIRRSEKKETMHEGTLSKNIKAIEESLERIVDDVKLIRSEIDPNKPQDVHQRISEKLPDHLETFIESRKSIGHVYGLQAYGHVMNYFATAERYLNRVWSASADGYIDEIMEYMERSEQQFEEALVSLRGLAD
jgi:archaellum component FlaC